MKSVILNSLLAVILTTGIISCKKPAHIIYVEAENFSHRGGWVIDQQSIDLIGSSYILAHGLGVPVEDAETTIEVPSAGNYKVWVRTRNWVAPWNEEISPGRFQLVVDGVPLDAIFGTNGIKWHWQNGGRVNLNKGKTRLSLRDLTGFEGRCDAIIFTDDPDLIPPENRDELYDFRKNLAGQAIAPEDAGEYDLVVVGGGVAGCCAALSAARYGCKVALIQNRPVLGGNNSSEVRVGLSGLIYQQPYPKLGRLVDEIGSIGHWTLWEAIRDPDSPRSRHILEVIEKNPEKKIHNTGPASNYGDEKKLAVIEAEPNINLFLNTHVFRVEMDEEKITSVTGKNIVSGKEIIVRGKLFADCTGDANLGFLAGADYRIGRESKDETGEKWAPEKSDSLVMGASVQWFAELTSAPSSFPECPWAEQFDENTSYKVTRGDWDWETGLTRDQINDIEFIRDYAFRVTYGNWDFIKNKSSERQKFENYKLEWVAHIAGKRESRRLMGDVILSEHDILQRVEYPDASFTTTWNIDLHYPYKLKDFNGEPFRAYAETRPIDPYPVPYRCLYSRNIENLFMAGRDISVTHVALGTVRVMRTGGMMGEVVGMAASLCRKYDVLPRDIYKIYLEELKNLMKDGVPSRQD